MEKSRHTAGFRPSSYTNLYKVAQVSKRYATLSPHTPATHTTVLNRAVPRWRPSQHADTLTSQSSPVSLPLIPAVGCPVALAPGTAARGHPEWNAGEKTFKPESPARGHRPPDYMSQNLMRALARGFESMKYPEPGSSTLSLVGNVVPSKIATNAQQRLCPSEALLLVLLRRCVSCWKFFFGSKISKLIEADDRKRKDFSDYVMTHWGKVVWFGTGFQYVD